MMAAEVPIDAEEDLFEVANLSPALTGLPMMVWISERGRSRDDVRVKVSLVHGRRAHPDRTCSVALRPTIAVVAGPDLPPGDLAAVRRWIELNRDVIVAYWRGDLLTDEAIARLRPISP